MRVLILRPKELLDDTVERFRREGFEAYGCPFVELEFLDFEVPEHDYAIITSQNAARAIVKRGIKLKKVIAIGKKTADVLKGYEVLTPSSFDSRSIVREFAPLLKGKRVVAIRSDRGSEELRKLSEVADFREVVAYRIRKLQGEEQRRAVELVEECFYDVVVFSSRMIAESFVELCDPEALKSKTLVAIGPPTAEFLRSKNLECLVPDEYTFDGVMELLKNLRDGCYRC
ncbi:MAG: uroporphyrinogen-III synthase [Archaeoglobaceae archaeon]